MLESLTVNLKPGRKVKHGGYSFLSKGKLPQDRAYIERYLTACRQGLVEDSGGDHHLSTAKTILIDRIISKLGVIRCIEEHTLENAVMIGQELAPALKASYLAYSNSIRLDLQALGLEKRSIDDGRTVQDVIKEFDQAKASK